MNDTPLKIIEPSPAPEIFVDGYVSSAFANGVVKFTFVSGHHDPRTDTHSQAVVLRLTSSLAGVASIHDAMGRFLEQLREQMMTDEAKAN